MDALRFTFIVVGVLLVVVSIPLVQRKIPRNGWYGVRLPLTLRDDQAWYDINAYAGRRMVVLGAVEVICGLVFSFLRLSLDAYSILLLVAFVIPMTVIMIQTVAYIGRYTKDHSKKQK